jgi:hypothetical protein
LPDDLFKLKRRYKYFFEKAEYEPVYIINAAKESPDFAFTKSLFDRYGPVFF